jgi:SRSO17 transposase
MKNTTSLTKKTTSPSGIEERFEEYVKLLSSTLGHSDRIQPFTNYCAGLLLPGDRKSIEPMAAVVAPDRVSSTHQMMHHFVAKRMAGTSFAKPKSV